MNITKTLSNMPDHSPEWLENPSVRVELSALVCEARKHQSEKHFPEGFIEQVFAEMRFNTEGILIEAAKIWPDMPDCTSQKHRALAAIDRAKKAIAALHENRASGEKLSPLYRMKSKLEDFCAMHRAIYLLQWRERNGNLDHA